MELQVIVTPFFMNLYNVFRKLYLSIMLNIYTMKLKYFFALLLSLAFAVQSCNAQTPKEGVKWMSFEEAEKQFKANPKPILVDIYTDWCGWCKKMDKVTYANPEVIKFINANYYPVKFDAESNAKIDLFGKTFQNTTLPTGNRKPPHELASFLMQGKMSYPTTVFIDMSKGSISPQPVPGYLDVPTMELVLKYLADSKNQTIPFETFQKQFVGEWK